MDVGGDCRRVSFRKGTSDMSFNPSGAHSDGATISSATVLTKAGNKLLIQALTQNVRYTLDGTTPTATTGFQLVAGNPPIIIPVEGRTVVTVIQEAATADLQYCFGN